MQFLRIVQLGIQFDNSLRRFNMASRTRYIEHWFNSLSVDSATHVKFEYSCTVVLKPFHASVKEEIKV